MEQWSIMNEWFNFSLTEDDCCLPQPVANDNKLPLLWWRWWCYWCCSCGLSPIEQTHHMSNILSLLQLHNRWLTQAHRCLPQLVANDNNLPLLLITVQNAVNCFYQVLCSGRFLTFLLLHFYFHKQQNYVRQCTFFFWHISVSHITYTVLAGDVRHCSIQSNPVQSLAYFLAALVSFNCDCRWPNFQCGRIALVEMLDVTDCQNYWNFLPTSETFSV